MLVHIVCVLAPVSVHQENWLQQFTNWDTVSLNFFFFFCLHLYLQSGRGLWPLHPLQIFVSLGFAGFSSYRKSIPEVASSHMVLIATPPLPFFPADFAGSEAARTSQPGPVQGASGCEGMRKRLKVCVEGRAEEGKSKKKWSYTLSFSLM